MHRPRAARRPPRYLTQFPDLATYIAETGDTQANIAAAVGVSQAHVSRIAHGVIVPRPRLAARIAAHAHIPLDSFARVYLAKQGAA